MIVWFVELVVDWCTGLSVGLSIRGLVDCPVGRFTGCLVVRCLGGWLFDVLLYQFVVWLNGRLVVPLVGWLVELLYVDFGWLIG